MTHTPTISPAKKIIFVLGMHRSGTSLIAKAAQIAGAELGNNLMQASDDNPTGFWEDIDIFQFNERLLESLDIRWDIPSVLSTVDFSEQKFAPLKREAIRILKPKLAACSILAIKDPRICLLMPFWMDVTKTMKLTVQFVVAVRHPMDVAQSLSTRNQLDEQKSLTLWLNHNFLILKNLSAYPEKKLFVDYQKILTQPADELTRMTRFISGAKKAKQTGNPQIQSFLNEFIDPTLCHSESDQTVLNQLDEQVPGLVPLYQCLQEFSNEHWSRTKAVQLLKTISADNLEAQNYQLQLHYFKAELKHALDSQYQSLAAEQKALQEKTREDKDQFYKEIIQQKDSEFQNTLQTIVETKDREFQIFTKDLVNQKDLYFQSLVTQLVDKNDEKLRKNNRLLQTRSDQLHALKQEMWTETDKKDRYIENLEKQHEQVLESRSRTHEQVLQSRSHTHEQALEAWSHAVEAIKTSYSWKLTAPLRISLSIFNGIENLLTTRGYRCQLHAATGLKQEDSGAWITVDGDPQFNLNVSRTHISKGWHFIQLNAQVLNNDSTLYPELFVDYGKGYEKEILLNYTNGHYEATVFFHQAPASIRIDPCSYSGVRFQLSKIKLRKIPLPVFIASASINIYKRDRANNRTPTDIIKEKLQLIHKFGLSYTINNLHTLISHDEEAVDWGVDYPRWVSEVESQYFNSLENEAGEINNSKPNNKHAILIIANTLSDTHIDLSIESVQKQLLSPDEICIIHKKNNKIYCYPVILGKYSKKVIFNKWAEATPANIITLVNLGCELSRYYLYSVETVLSKTKYYDLIYCDNDEISAEGVRSNPQFKPDWSPDFVIESNYIGETFSLPLESLKKTLSQYRHDLILLPVYILYKLAIKAQSNIKHIPYVLTHENNDTPKPLNNKQYGMLKQVLEQRNKGGLFESKDVGQYKFTHPLPDPLPSVAIIIPTKDKVELLKVCIETLREKTDYTHYEIIVIDNNSTELDTQDYFKILRQKFSIKILAYNKPFNYSAINNFAVSQCTSDILCFLNNDIEITNSHWLRELVSHTIRPTVGCVGAKLYYPDGRVQHAGVIIGIGGVAGHAFGFEAGESNGYQNRLASVQNYSAVTAACMVVRKELFCSVGGFNEKQLPVAFNDVDFCLRLKELGYQVIWTPHAELIHHESATRVDDKKRMDEIKTEVQFMQIRWRNWISDDPAYNPNLSLAIGKDFEYSLRLINRSNDTRKNTSEVNPASNPYQIESNEDRIATIVTEQKDQQFSQKTFKPGLSIIILTLEKPELISPLLESLIVAKQQLLDQNITIEIIVGDTGSTSPEIQTLYESVKQEITIIRNLNYHFSRCNNQLFAQYAQFDSTLFLNNDVIFKNARDSLYRMYEVLHANKETGIVGSFLTYPDGRLQHGGVSIIETGDDKGLCYHPGHGTAFKQPAINYVKVMPGVTGACLLIHSDLFIRCGLFDPHYAAEAQDIELCFQVHRIGYKSILCYPGEIHHLENATRPKGEANNKDRARFVRKWALFYSEILQ